MFNDFFFDNRAVYETTWEKKYCRAPARPQMKRWRMRFSCWIPNATKTHLKYVIIIACHCKMVARMILNVTFIRTLPILSQIARQHTTILSLHLMTHMSHLHSQLHTCY